MKLYVVDAAKCIGCGTCVSIAGQSFRLNDQGKSEPVNPPGDPEQKIQEAVDSCPVDAIIVKEEKSG